MPVPVTAIFDIGKTNKKFLLFDEGYNVVWQKKEQFEETTDDDGDPCEDIERLTNWARQTLKQALVDDQHDIQVLNFSTYGASFVHLDGNGRPVTPLYNYLKDYPDDLLDKFYETHGDRQKIALETASPPMGMLNSGLQLYWLKKRKPELFKQIEHTLHLPQYLSYLFTKEYHSEITSIGCHTALWDFKKNTYHRWVKEENLERLLPDIVDVSETKAVSINNKSLDVGLGIHDSSAALTPFLLAVDEPFVLLSTGTWSIAFNPFNHDPLTYEELEKDCLSYINIEGKPVKAARYFLGGEYAHQKRKLDHYFNHDGSKDDMTPDAGMVQTIRAKQSEERRLVQEKANASGPAPHPPKGEWDVSPFPSYKEAYHQLVHDLVDIQCKALDLAIGDTPVKKIFVTGGFTQNPLFIRLLATRYPQKEIYTTSLSNSTALGAAVVLNKTVGAMSEKRSQLKNLLVLRRHKSLESIAG